jgi:hypothetical protein
MAATTAHLILGDVLERVGKCLTPAVASRIAALRADPRLQQRLDELAEKNAKGKLTAQDEAEYEAYVEALDVIAVLQAKARQALKVAGRGR